MHSDQPVAKRVTKIVKSEPLTILDLHSSFFRSRPEMIRHKYGRGQRDATARLEGRKDNLRILLVRRLAAPLLQMMRQDRMQGNVASDASVLVSPSLPFAQLFEIRIRSSSHRMSAQRSARISEERSAVAAQVNTRVW
jgi:hypothetical protein